MTKPNFHLTVKTSWGLTNLNLESRSFDGKLLISFMKEENTCARVFNKIEGLIPTACNFIKSETLAEVFSCEFCQISNKTFSYRTP